MGSNFGERPRRPREKLDKKDIAPEKNFDKDDLPYLQIVLSEMQRLLALMKKEVLPKLRAYGLSKGHNPDKVYGQHAAGLPEQPVIEDLQKAEQEYSKSWYLLQPNFSGISPTFFNKLTSITLNESGLLAQNLNAFILNISNPPHAGRAYSINPIELLSDLDLAVTRIQTTIVDVIKSTPQ